MDLKPASLSNSDWGTPTLEFERKAGFPFFKIVGVDEVGRGCLAGPVVAAAVRLPPSWDLPLAELVQAFPEIAGITDSKKLSSKRRSALAPWIREHVQAYGIGWASVDEVDRLNIYHASHLAMVRAAGGCGSADGYLVDGNVVPRALQPQQASRTAAIVKGDLRSLSVACASIIAKVYRDEWMDRLAEEFPGYGFEVHKGYATARHRAALLEKGVCPIHRRSFGPVQEKLTENLSLQSSWSTS